jgi:predicted dehydrogenase
MLRIGIIGMGWAGTRHVEAIRELGAKITVDCIVDNDAEFLRAKAAEFGIRKTYTDYEDALADPAVEAVSICLPHALHSSVAIAAAEAGKHILCEKPIALTVDDATLMIAAAEAHGVKLYVAENDAYTPMARFLKQMVTTGDYIGELTCASLVRGFQALDYGFPGRRAWLSTPELGGTGTWMLHGVHSMAQLRFVLGEVESVYIQQHRAGSFKRQDVEGTMSGLLTLKSGVHVSVMQTAETYLGDWSGYVLYGDAGVARASRQGVEVLTNTRDRLPLDYPEHALSAYAQEMEAFADYVAGVSVGPTTGRSERRSLAVVQAGYESSETGQPVNLRARFGDI